MALSLQQSQEYLGQDRRRWSVWVEGTQEELDSIEYVTYILHPTFHKPVRVVGDRTTNFRLDTSGWGTFTIHARATYHDGRETELSHELLLLYPDGTATLA